MKRVIVFMLILYVNIFASGVYATFNVVANKHANLAFSSGGIVKDTFVDISDVVKKGQVLATLKSDDLKALVDLAKVTLKYARLDYQRQLKVKTMINKAKFDRYAFKFESAKADLMYKKALLDKTILKAPFDGVIYDKSLESGDVVSGQMIKVVFKIQSRFKRKLVLEFDEKYLHKVKVGDIFRYRLDTDKIDKEVKISKIYPTIDTKTRKIKAEALSSDIKVGLFGHGEILVTDL